MLDGVLGRTERDVPLVADEPVVAIVVVDEAVERGPLPVGTVPDEARLHDYLPFLWSFVRRWASEQLQRLRRQSHR